MKEETIRVKQTTFACFLMLLVASFFGVGLTIELTNQSISRGYYEK